MTDDKRSELELWSETAKVPPFPKHPFVGDWASVDMNAQRINYFRGNRTGRVEGARWLLEQLEARFSEYVQDNAVPVGTQPILAFARKLCGEDV